MMTRQQKRFEERKLRKLKLVPCDVKMTASSGLGTILEIFDKTSLAEDFKKCLPTRVSPRSVGGYLLGLMVLAGHIHEAESLSDIAKIKGDPALEVLFESDVAAARTIGDYLRDFEDIHLNNLNEFLGKMSRSLIDHLKLVQVEEHRPVGLTIDIDSTDHIHYGEKIEGLAYNYKGHWCLDTQVAFNSYGFCHGLQLRPGNTKSGVDAVPLIYQSFGKSKTQKERRLSQKYFFRADSAYCYQEVFKACLDVGCIFTITAHDGTTGWKKLMESEPLIWQPWIYSKEELEKAEGKELPKVELSRMHWKPSWADEKLMFPIVIKRTWKKESEEDRRGQRNIFYQDSIEDKGEWEYYAVVTNWNLSRVSLQDVMKHHQKRGNAENFVKEEKYGLKLNNFPCRSLKANRAWALLAEVAHNLLRWIALLQNPDKPHFSKKLRRQYVFNPGRVIRHARTIVLKVMRPFYEEVTRMCEALQATPIPAFSTV
jgi:Transposase DDE domain group 1